EGRCSLKSWVFKSFLKVERDAPALVVLGSSFHQRGTTNENSLDCRACTDGSAKRRSLDECSILGVTFALTLTHTYTHTHTHTHIHTHTHTHTHSHTNTRSLTHTHTRTRTRTRTRTHTHTRLK